MTSDRDRERAKEIADRVRAMWTDRDPVVVAAELGLAAGRAESALVWTSEPPMVPTGDSAYYWFRDRPGSSRRLIQHRTDGTFLLLGYVTTRTATWLRSEWPTCQFAGPLPLPQEPPR